MTPEAALAALRAEAEAQGAANSAGSAGAAGPAAREVLGLRVARITELTSEWRQQLTLEARIALAEALWQADIFESRIAAAKLLVQARIRPDQAVWALICDWVAQIDDLTIGEHVADAGARRLSADAARLDDIEAWVTGTQLWSQRCALIMTLPWARLNNPKPAEIAARQRILGWAAALVGHRDRIIQDAIARWLRELSKHDAALVRDFLAKHGAAMTALARNEAVKHLGPEFGEQFRTQIRQDQQEREREAREQARLERERQEAAEYDAYEEDLDFDDDDDDDDVDDDFDGEGEGEGEDWMRRSASHAVKVTPGRLP